MSELQIAIDQIGTELVTCGDCCAGIWREPIKGIVPRTLFVERAETDGLGCLAVGLNPGKSENDERLFYLQAGVSYESVKEYRRRINAIPYFQRARKIIDSLELRGPIVWSNLAKCENADGQKGLPPVETLRHCARRFLYRELDVTPADWPIIALGSHAFLALAYAAPHRAVLGIPHPTGANPQYQKMFVNGRLCKDIQTRAIAALSSNPPNVVWLGVTKSWSCSEQSEAV